MPRTVLIYPGLVTTLHGLNIANNPLEFPPESVVEGGTKSILAFFRDLLRAKSEAGFGGDYFSKKTYQNQIEVHNWTNLSPVTDHRL